LALEAFDREQITRAKLEELFAMILERPRPEISLQIDRAIETDKSKDAAISR
jgi:hypothetical protein